MYAIIRKGKGESYRSMVFGYYDCGKTNDDYSHRYWIILNEVRMQRLKIYQRVGVILKAEE